MTWWLETDWGADVTPEAQLRRIQAGPPARSARLTTRRLPDARRQPAIGSSVQDQR